MPTYGDHRAAKALAVSTVDNLVWSSSQIAADSRLVTAFHIGFTGTAHDFNSVSRHRVKSAEETILDVDEQELDSFAQAMSPSNLGYAASATSWSYRLGGMPHGGAMSVEIDTDGTGSGAGTARLSWSQADGPTGQYVKYIGKPANLAASTLESIYKFSQKGLMIGFSIPSDGFDRIILFLAGIGIVLNLSAVAFREVMLNENVTTDITSWFFKLKTPLPAGEGSYMLIDTNATWAGAAERIAIATVIPTVGG